MNYRIFGRTGLRVSELILGTMTFGDAWGDFGASAEESKKVFDAYVERGGNFIDTANGYTGGQSEEIVGNLIAGDRDRFVLATKYTFNKTADDPNGGGNHRKSIVRALDASLKRLKTDYIDVYWLHAWDFTTPVEEVVRALDDQVRAGKILYPAVSDTPAWIVSEANTIARLRGWTPFYALQVEWNLIERTVERDLVPMARAFDLPVTPWSPLAGGILTGKHRKGAADGSASNGSVPSGRGARAEQVDERSQATVDAVLAVAKETGVTPAQVSLAWLIGKGRDVFPILGAKRLDQFQDNIGALDVTLSPEQLARLDAASAIAAGFPHDFIDRILNDKMPVKLFGVPHERVERAAHNV
jgi:aryl-alcohol dehydrogenase-like predicted oxidoreductase